MPENIALLLVHGVGSTDERYMMRECAREIARIRPEWSIDNDVAELHKAPGSDPGRPPIQIRRGKARGRTICLADAYWGDISLVRADFLSTVWGVLINMFGLRYFASAAVNGNRFLTALFTLFAVLIAAVDIPLNIITLIYAMILLHVPVTHERMDHYLAGIALMLAAAIGGSATYWLSRKSLPAQAPRPLIRWALWGCLAICSGALALGIAVIILHFLGFGDLLPNAAKQSVAWYGNLIGVDAYRAFAQRPLCTDVDSGTTCITPAGALLAAIYMAQRYPLQLEVLLSVTSLVVVFALCLVRPRNAAGLLMSVASIHVIWFMFGALLIFVVPADIVTAVAINYSTYPSVPQTHYTGAWFEFLPGLYLLSVAVLVAVGSMLVARPWAKRQADKMWAAGERTAWVARHDAGPLVGPRLLVSHWFVGAMLVFSTIVAAYGAWLLFRIGHTLVTGVSVQSAIPPVNFTWNFLVHLIAIVVVAFALLGGALRIGLKAWMDVVDHFTHPAAGFPVREEIATRFKDAAQHLLATVKASTSPGADIHLSVLAHSQGTIIAIDKMMQGYFGDLLRDGVSRITLLTFGSPFTHVYQYYFKETYPDLSADLPSVARIQALSRDVRMTWINLYRIDDYVGTFVRGTGERFPLNVPLPTGGHTRYWEPTVFQEVSKHLPP